MKQKNKENKYQSDFWTKGIVILASIVGAMLVGAIFLVILGNDPLEVYRQLLLSPASSIGNMGQVLKNATPLIIIGVGVSIATKCGLSNLGGDGQFYMGALGFVLVNQIMGETFGIVAWVIGMLVAIVFGAATAAVAGVFKSYFKVSEIITTLMMNYIIIYFISYLVNGPLKSEGSTTAQTVEIAKGMQIPRMFSGVTMSYAIFIALGCAALYWVIINKTNFGYKIKVVGGSLKAAEYSGIKPMKYFFLVMVVSGAFGGLAGAVEVSSQQYRLMEGLSNDFGFNAVLVSLLGMVHPVGIVVASIFFAWLSAGANVMQIMCHVPVTFVAIIKGLMILFVLFGLSVKMEELKNPLKKQAKAMDEKEGK